MIFCSFFCRPKIYEISDSDLDLTDPDLADLPEFPDFDVPGPSRSRSDNNDGFSAEEIEIAIKRSLQVSLKYRLIVTEINCS